MAQNQRKKAGWQHEIDELAHGDFHNYIAITTARIKRWRRLAIAFALLWILSWVGWGLCLFGVLT